MTRILIYILIVLGLIAVALLFMPLRLAFNIAGLENSKFSAREISGSIWNGRIEEAQLGPIALGDLNAGVQFFPLFAGKVKLDLERPATASQSGLNATVGKQSKSLLVENLTTNLSLGSEFAPIPASNVEMDGVNITFAHGKCQAASGKVRLSLDANIPGLDLKQGLLGNAICENGVLILPLASGSGMEKLTFKLEGNGFYTARLSLTGNERAWTLLLPTLGFRQTTDGYALKVAGQLGR